MSVLATQGRLSLGSWSPPYLRPVLHIVARMLVALSAAMLLPAIADLIAGEPTWTSFLLGSGVTLLCGAGLWKLTHCHLSGGLTLRQSFVLTPLAYTTLAG